MRFMQFPFGSSLFLPSLYRFRDGSGYERDHSFQTFVDTTDSSSLSHYSVLCALRVSFSHLCDFVKETFPFWIVGAPHHASEIPQLPRFHRRLAFMLLAPFRVCVSCNFLSDLRSFFLPSTDSEMGQGMSAIISFRLLSIQSTRQLSVSLRRSLCSEGFTFSSLRLCQRDISFLDCGRSSPCK
jgi:hypothetical protein